MTPEQDYINWKVKFYEIIGIGEIVNEQHLFEFYERGYDSDEVAELWKETEK